MSNTISLTAKVRLKPTSEQATKILEVMMVYRDACQYVSEYVFNNNFVLDWDILHKALYRTIRHMFKLNSQMAQSVIRTVVARYKATRTQLFQQSVQDGFKTLKDGKQVKNMVPKTLEFLWQPISFKQPQIDLVRGRNYQFTKDGKLSIGTLDGREKMAFVFQNNADLFAEGSEWKQGTACLVRSGKHWYLYVSVTKPIEPVTQIKTVVGVDRGLLNLLTTYDDNKVSQLVSGRAVSHKRHDFATKRQSLQSKGTRSPSTCGRPLVLRL